MEIRLRFTTSTIARLRLTWENAYELGDLRLVRCTSALLALSHGGEVSTIAQDLSVSAQTVYSWMRAFLVEGFDCLCYRKSPGRRPKLKQTHKTRLRDILNAGPVAYGFTTGCWSSLLIQQVILKEFGILYSRFYVCTLLHNIDYSYQKAKFASDHLDPQARKKWLEQTWPDILKEVKRRNAQLLFVDEASFPQWGSLSYTWALKGHQPQVLTCGVRKAYKVFGAVDALSGRLFYQGIEGRFNSLAYQQFLKMVMSKTRKHLIIIQDGARYHTSKDTKAFFQAHKDRLSCCQLPGYSPDFNPIEHLWKSIRKDATHNKYFAQFHQVIDSVETVMQFLILNPQQVRKTLGKYATAQDIMPKAA
jgi:transposase